MRTACLALACFVVCVAGVGGCYESLTDIVTPDKVVFYGDLVGQYKAVEPATGRLTLTRAEGKDAYQYTQYDEKDALVNKGTLWLVKLGDEHFYQCSVDGYATADGRPVYAVGRLRIEGKAGSRTLTGYAFKSRETLFDDPTVKTAEYEYVENGERKKSRALSMTPAELQSALTVRAAGMTEPVLKFEQTTAAPSSAR
jgi:hypothetical protein